MTTYFTSLFTMMLSSQPEVLAASGLTPADIAAATAEQCFEEADTNGDGDITFEEFQEWFHSGGAQVLQPKGSTKPSPAPAPAAAHQGTQAPKASQDASAGVFLQI